MNFGEKIFRLRKEKGLSQEALAERLGTTRQAVSKWENNQGFPETEKLLQISDLFQVSTDFLLKEGSSEMSPDQRGFYVSREMAEAYIAHERRVSGYLGMGYLFLSMTGIPFSLFGEGDPWRYLGMSASISAGAAFLVLGMFAEEERYRVLKREPLLLDYECRKALDLQYQAKKKKYMAAAVPSILLFVLGVLIVARTSGETFLWPGSRPLAFLGFGLGLLGFTRSMGMMEAYERLVENERYTSRLWFRIRRKIMDRI